LRLSGVLETLEARNRQAIEGQWSYVEFLSRLLEDEIARRAQKQIKLRLRRAALNTAALADVLTENLATVQGAPPLNMTALTLAQRWCILLPRRMNP
jgi:DNA replication protein DnaC